MKRKIVIADDDPVHRAHLARLINRLGHDALVASSGEEALGLIMANRDPSIAALLIDLVMPDLDGMAVITRLRAAGYRIPIIVLAKPTALDSALAAIAAGAQDFSLIPASYERIAVSLKNLLAPSVFPRTESVISTTPSSAAVSLSQSKMRPRHEDAQIGSISVFDHAGRLRSLAAIEKDVIALAMKWRPNSVASLARDLGISRSTLYRRMEEWDHTDLDLDRDHTFHPPAYGDAA